MSKGPRFTPKEERDLIIRAKAGDKAAAARLVAVHTPFIAAVLRHLTVPRWVSQEDLMQQGRVGLLDAIHRFDLSTNYRLLTFAFWRIKKEIISYLSEMGYPARIPFPDALRLRKIYNAIDNGETISEEDRRQLQAPRNIHIMQLLPGGVSIHPTEHGGMDGGEPDYAHGIQGELLSPDEADHVINEILLADIATQVSALSALEGTLLGLRYGIYATDSPLEPQEILGDKTRMMGGEPVGGRAGFGLEIGETHHSLPKTLGAGERKLQSLYRKAYNPSGCDEN